MKKQETIFDFIGRGFQLFGITILMLLVIAIVLGDQTKNSSIMFSLGDDGLPTSTLIQFLFVSMAITGINKFFFTTKWLKHGSTPLRTIGMLTTILILISTCSYFFEWFPVDDLSSWLLFFCFFIISFGVSVLVVFWKEKIENKQIKEGLNRVQVQLEEDIDGKNY